MKEFMERIVMIILICTMTVVFVSCGTTVEGQLELAVKFYQEGKYEEAILVFDKAIAIDDKIPTLHYAKALAQWAMQDQDGAMDSIYQALTLRQAGIEDQIYVDIFVALMQNTTYKTEQDMALIWLENNYENEEESELADWIRDYLGETYAEELAIMEADDETKAIYHSLQSVLENKPKFENMQEKRAFVDNPEPAYPEDTLRLADYNFRNGVFTYRVEDFDQDGNKEILTLETEDNNLWIRLYEINENEAILTAEKMNRLLNDNLCFEEMQMYLKEHNGMYYLLYNYNELPLLSAGESPHTMCLYNVSDGLSVMFDEYLVGADYEEEAIIPNIQRQFRAAGITWPGFFEDSDAELVVSVSQSFSGSYDELYATAPVAENIEPMDITLNVVDVPIFSAEDTAQAE